MAKKFNIDVVEKWCKGCGLCIAICPKKVLELNDQVKCVAVRPEDCIGCKLCQMRCPDFAIEVEVK